MAKLGPSWAEFYAANFIANGDRVALLPNKTPQDNLSPICREVAAQLDAPIRCDQLDIFEGAAYNRFIETAGQLAVFILQDRMEDAYS